MAVNIAELLKRPIGQVVAEGYKANFPMPKADPAHVDLAAKAYSTLVTPHISRVTVSRTAARAIFEAQERGEDTDSAVITAAEVALNQGRKKIGVFGAAKEKIAHLLPARTARATTQPVTVFEASTATELPPKKSRKQERIEAMNPRVLRRAQNNAIRDGFDPRKKKTYVDGVHQNRPRRKK